MERMSSRVFSCQSENQREMASCCASVSRWAGKPAGRGAGSSSSGVLPGGGVGAARDCGRGDAQARITSRCLRLGVMVEVVRGLDTEVEADERGYGYG